jgi:hypothetical protein
MDEKLTDDEVERLASTIHDLSEDDKNRVFVHMRRLEIAQELLNKAMKEIQP